MLDGGDGVSRRGVELVGDEKRVCGAAGDGEREERRGFRIEREDVFEKRAEAVAIEVGQQSADVRVGALGLGEGRHPPAHPRRAGDRDGHGRGEGRAAGVVDGAGAE